MRRRLLASTKGIHPAPRPWSFIGLLCWTLVACSPTGDSGVEGENGGQTDTEPPSSTEESWIEVGEVVGEVTDSSAEVFLQLSSPVPEGLSLKMCYGTSRLSEAHACPNETPTQTEIMEGEKRAFSIPGGLSPNTRYYYRIAYNLSPSRAWTLRPERSFHTRRTPGAPFRFCVVTDLHMGSPQTRAILTQLARNVAADEPDFVVSLGDMIIFSNQGFGIPADCALAYYASYQDYSGHSQGKANLHYAHALAHVLSEFSHSSMLVWVNGNHEGLAGYLSTCPQYEWALNARRKYIPLLDNDEPNAFFGDFVWGDVHIIWLDALAFSTYDPYVANDPIGYALGSDQKDWLEATLARSTSRWKLIFAHTLFGGAGPDFPCLPGRSYARGNAAFVDTPGTDQIAIQSLMESYGANAYFYGHDHMYSVSEYGDSGVKYVLSGTGLVSSWNECLVAYYAPWPTIRTSIGHLRVDVNTDSIAIQYVKANLDERR